jgi:hypothetical protein
MWYTPCVREIYQSWSDMEAIVTVAAVSPVERVSTRILPRKPEAAVVVMFK